MYGNAVCVRMSDGNLCRVSRDFGERLGYVEGDGYVCLVIFGVFIEWCMEVRGEER